MTASRNTPPATLTRTNMIGVVAGNVLEFYDFTLFAFFAPQIGATMFAHGKGTDGLLLALATFAVGFIARPVGAVMIGRYADQRGRKPAMVLSFALMGSALIAVGITPPSSMLGVWSAIIIALARLVQGFALGGEVGPTTALLIEAAPAERRGFYGAWQIASQGIAVLIAGLVGLAITFLLSPQAVIDWGWRIGMLLGALILPIGFHLRRIMPETLHIPEQGALDSEAAALPLARVASIGLLLILAGTVTTYTVQYFNTYSVAILKLKPSLAFTTTAITGGSMFAFGLFGGWLSDRFGRRAVIVLPRLLLLLLIYPVFVRIQMSPSLATLSIGVFLLTSLYAMSTATANVCLAESFPRARRSTAYALIYTLAVSVFGGSAQFAITWLIKQTGSQLMPAWWLLGATLVGIVAGVAMPMVGATYRRSRHPDPVITPAG